MLQAVVPHSAKAFNFHDAYNLSEEMVSCGVSQALNDKLCK